MLWLTLDETVVFPPDLEWRRIEQGRVGLASSHALLVAVTDPYHVGFVSAAGDLLRVVVFPDEHTTDWWGSIRRTPAVVLLRAPADVTSYGSFHDALHHAEAVVVPALTATDSTIHPSPHDHR